MLSSLFRERPGQRRQVLAARTFSPSRFCCAFAGGCVCSGRPGRQREDDASCLASGQPPKRQKKLSRSSSRSEEHTSELQSLAYLVCRLLLEKKNSPNNPSAS